MMKSRQQSSVLFLRVISDQFLIFLSWILAIFFRFYSGLPIPKGVPDTIQYIKLIPFIGVIWLAVFSSTGLYKRTGSHRSAIFEALDIMSASLFAVIVFVAFTSFYDEYRYSRLVLVMFTFIHPVAIITGRSVLRKALRFYVRTSPPRKILIIGGGNILEQGIDTIKQLGLFRADVLGIVSFGDEAEKTVSKAVAAQLNVSLLPLPKPQDWSDFLIQYPAQTLLIAVSAKSYGEFWEHFHYISPQVLDIRLIPDVLKFSRFASRLDLVGGTPIITINDSPLAGSGQMLKRILDILGASFGLVILTPIFALVALLVKGTSPGPILYAQERMGLDGRPFKILKFRSMPIDAEAKTGAVWAKPGDERTTAIGRFIRKTSLDELPQLFNVLKGEMSLVGPRPERPVFVDKFRKDIPDYMLRHKVKAGITGWAQINGWRGDTSIEKRIECDLYYIQNWSLWLDIKIILLTFVKGFVNKNAY